jgi:ubiquinone/menaquinone biosynthesis C-methylase UbiE
MLDMLRRRAEKAGMADRIRLHPCEKDRLGIAAEVDFALVFAMLHEVPDQNRMLGEILQALKPGGKLLLAEPPIHVTAKTFSKEAAMAEETGFQLLERPRLRWSHAAVFAKVAPK